MATVEAPRTSQDSIAYSEPVDPTSTPQSLARAVYGRRSEYVRPHRIRVKVGTWNVAGCPGTDKDLASWFVDGKGIDRNLQNLSVSENAALDASATTHQTPKASSLNGESNDDEIRLMGTDQIGLYVLGLQEIVDLNVARDTVNRMTYVDPGPMNKWKQALEEAMPPGYELITSEQMSGLLLLVYASPQVAPSISNVSTVQVGTGLFGYMGNKGAVTTRLMIGETTRMVFVNSHLASGVEQLDRRLWDHKQILDRTRFEPVQIAGAPPEESEKIGDEDFCFWLGDLNFRLDGLPGNDIRRILMLHTRGEYDLSKKNDKALGGEDVLVVKHAEEGDGSETDDGADSSTIASTTSPAPSFEEDDDTISSLPDPDDFLPDPHDDPASLQATLDSLLPHDQLGRVIKQKKAFHDGWREGNITFLPSYKYDLGTVGLFDSSEKQRAPSWCDRILFRTRKDKDDYDHKVREEEESKRKDAEMKAQGLEDVADDDDVLFSYDPEADAEPEEQPKILTAESSSGFDEYDEYDENEDDGNVEEEVVTKEGFTDRIQLDIYTSHQRVTSSDHKPVISIFTLDYNAVVPEMKAKVHAEVARELDRAENEGRPLITVVVDSHDSTGKETSGQAADQGEPVDFGAVGYLAKRTMRLTIANTGRAAAKFAFVEKPTVDEGDASNPAHWLNTKFERSDEGSEEEAQMKLEDDVTLEPGETVAAVLEVLIQDITHVRALNDGRTKLEDVLVLRVVDGRDHFIPIQGKWIPTCFGRSIEELIRVPEGGIRDFVAEKCPDGGSIPYSLDAHSAAPRELFRLTEAIEGLTSRIVADENMLDEQVIPANAPGWPFEYSTWLFKDESSRRTHLLAVVEALDTGKSVLDALPLDTPAQHRLEVVAEALMLFIKSLTDGIISAPLWAKIESNMPQLANLQLDNRTSEEIDDDKAAILDILAGAPHHNVSFVFLTAALATLSTEFSPITKAEWEALAASGAEKGAGSLARRSLSFRRMTGGGAGNTEKAAAKASLARRRAREHRFADVLGRMICRGGLLSFGKDKERKAGEEKMRTTVEMFLRREV